MTVRDLKWTVEKRPDDRPYRTSVVRNFHSATGDDGVQFTMVSRGGHCAVEAFFRMADGTGRTVEITHYVRDAAHRRVHVRSLDDGRTACALFDPAEWLADRVETQRRNRQALETRIELIDEDLAALSVGLPE